jgi:hypothetical protein
MIFTLTAQPEALFRPHAQDAAHTAEVNRRIPPERSAELPIKVARMLNEEREIVYDCGVAPQTLPVCRLARRPVGARRRDRVLTLRRRTRRCPPQPTRAPTRDVLNLIHEAEQRDARVTVLDPYVSTRGRWAIILTAPGIVAHMERRFSKER